MTVPGKRQPRGLYHGPERRETDRPAAYQYLDGRPHAFAIDRRAGRATFLIDEMPVEESALIHLVANAINLAMDRDMKAGPHGDHRPLCQVQWHGAEGDLNNGKLSTCALLALVDGRIKPMLEASPASRNGGEST